MYSKTPNPVFLEGTTFTSPVPWTNTTDGVTQPLNLETSAVQQALSYTLTGIVALVMVGMGCGVDLQKLKGHIIKPTGIIVGFVCQFVIMPIIAFTLSKIAQLDDLETLGLLLVGSCPGGTTSNIATYWIEGDMNLSVSMTTMSTILGLGMMPLLLYIYSFGFESDLIVPFDTIGITLGSLIVPIIIGICIRIKYPIYAEKILKILSVVGGIAVLLTVIASLISYGTDLSVSPQLIACGAFFPIIGILLGYGLSSLISLSSKLNLRHKERRTICIETGVQNTQLAGAIIQLSFTLGQVLRLILFPVIYLVSQVVWLAILISAYRVYAWKYGKRQQNIQIEAKDDDKCKNGEVKEKYNEAFEAEPPDYDQSFEKEKEQKF